MDFTYVDIFDTKGIEYIIVIFFFLLVIPFWRMLNRPLKPPQALAKTGDVLSYSMIRVPRGIFFNRNHSWAQLEPTGLAMVGMDDLLLHLTGGVSVESLVEKGQDVKKGEVIARMVQGEKKLEVRSPLSGEISAFNSEVVRNPGILHESPYDAWLCKIDPENWKEETRSALLASEAGEWIRTELDRFKDFMAIASAKTEGSLAGEILQTGGALVDFPLAEADPEIWKEFQRSFMENS